MTSSGLQHRAYNTDLAVTSYRSSTKSPGCWPPGPTDTVTCNTSVKGPIIIIIVITTTTTTIKQHVLHHVHINHKEANKSLKVPVKNVENVKHVKMLKVPIKHAQSQSQSIHTL